MKGIIPKEPVPVPCKICYLPMQPTAQGLACPTHGVPPKKKEKATRL